MLTRACEKAQRGGSVTLFAAADALHLPFGDASFDLVTTAFGFRNLANYEQGLARDRPRAEARRGSGHSRVYGAFERPLGGSFPLLLPAHPSTHRRRYFWKQRGVQISSGLGGKIPVAIRSRCADGESRIFQRANRCLEFRQRDFAFRAARHSPFGVSRWGTVSRIPNA